jgi:phosphatidate cytidylyltransferase
MSKVTKRVLTGVSLAAGVALLLVLDARLRPGLVAWFAATPLAALAVVELDRMGSFRGRGLATALGLPLVALAILESAVALDAVGWLARAGEARLVLGGYAVVALGALAGFFLVRRRALPVAVTVALAVWSLPPLFGLILIDARWGVAGLACVIAMAKIGDVFGYFFGRALGRTHPFPNLSPGKTTAGCVASAVGGTGLGAALVASDALRAPGGVLAGAALGLLLNLAAQAGDLLESWVKRRAGVKDSSTLFGSSGGVLDVVDSLLLVAPTALVAFPLFLGSP